ncbi:glycosyltransferase family 2 protein [Staphylococcus haemolyticus]|uniref:glycosyltransferase family 2 protein n=1 Tax=Staphylococcus haemolyticus TaxID=1283 RepID=UPI003C6F7376
MFSVIIPVHNSWKTIDRTINKTLNSFIDINDEIILVNDNSNECTIQKLNYYSKYPNIRVINNLGVGVSDARNSGIEIINKKMNL